ncbi:MAG: DUF3108 domain-containing protein [Bacteroidia bacterium]|nr:DUF3108 domain-containing protein [Bacteroidia bacterium]
MKPEIHQKAGLKGTKKACSNFMPCCAFRNGISPASVYLTMRWLILLVFPFFLSGTDPECPIEVNAFEAGERLDYRVMYNWGVIWVEAGYASFTTELGTYDGKPAYHFVGRGRTYDKYDFIYKVRDYYDSYADTATLKPYRYRRDINEGGRVMYEDARFSHKKNKVYTMVRKEKEVRVDSVTFGSCVVDVMTAIYYARCMDFNKYKVNDTIPLNLYLENQTHSVFIRYLGKEEKQIGKLGKIKCIKFSPLLIEGTIFSGGEGMTVWATDDHRKIPVYVETPILVGKVKVMISKKP